MKQLQALLQKGGGCLLEAQIIREGFKRFTGNKNKRRS